MRGFYLCLPAYMRVCLCADKSFWKRKKKTVNPMKRLNMCPSPSRLPQELSAGEWGGSREQNINLVLKKRNSQNARWKCSPPRLRNSSCAHRCSATLPCDLAHSFKNLGTWERASRRRSFTRRWWEGMTPTWLQFLSFNLQRADVFAGERRRRLLVLFSRAERFSV